MPRAAERRDGGGGGGGRGGRGGARGGRAGWREGAKRMTPLGSAQLERSRRPPEDTN